MKKRTSGFRYEKQSVLQIAMPLGGIGAGCVCLNGYGGLQNFSIRNRPSVGPLPERFVGRDAAFALLHVRGEQPVSRLVEGPFPPEKIFNQGQYGNGHLMGRYEGLPRFGNAVFEGAYPFGTVRLSDPALPLTAEVTGWSPFIPLDDVASGIPGAILEYTFHNPGKKKVDFDFCYVMSHLAPGSDDQSLRSRNEVIPGRGIHFFNEEPAGGEHHGSVSLTVVGHRPRIKAMWLRGGWLDAISSLWREIDSERFKPNDGQEKTGRWGRNGGAILLNASLKPGESVTYPIVITWHFPNCHYGVGEVEPAPVLPDAPKWRPYYVSRWKNAAEVAAHTHRHYADLRRRTAAFRDALFGSTLPREVIDAVSANLAILKSPTVLRQENGNLWGWEGCFVDEGCCHGSCTHVWNYAQALPNLFPQLERTLRHQELERSMDENGHVNFRAALPDGPTSHNWHAAADGQLGGIMKLWRDWQIFGDGAWLKRLYPLARRSLEYCIRQWDPDRVGALVEPHHNTYDIEFWGPDGMCSSVYLGALSAMSLMAAALGKKADAATYSALAEKGARYLDEHLFNGDYYEQKVRYKDLRDRSFLKTLSGETGIESSEALAIVKKEGPKYQYGSGCLSDGIIGVWMARLYGIPHPLNIRHVRRNLRSIFRYNFRKSLVDHANLQRPGYALGEEAGLLICSWPKGDKPTLPFPYSDEVMTGMEYQVAIHLILEGYLKEGLTIVKALRSRYQGTVRNPWNEYECGNFYARAMASYGLLGALSGFRYSAVEKTLWFGPRLKKRPFQTFFSTASGYGTIRIDTRKITISLLEGTLSLRRVVLTDGSRAPAESALHAEVKCGTPLVIPLSGFRTASVGQNDNFR